MSAGGRSLTIAKHKTGRTSDGCCAIESGERTVGSQQTRLSFVLSGMQDGRRLGLICQVYIAFVQLLPMFLLSFNFASCLHSSIAKDVSIPMSKIEFRQPAIPSADSVET